MNEDFPETNTASYVQLLSLRASGHVKRWHAVPIIIGQTVAEHSAQALNVLLALHPSPSLNLIKCVLWHDTGERIIGDVPSPGKWLDKEFAECYNRLEKRIAKDNHSIYSLADDQLTESERQWLASVDVLELMLKCDDEIYIGNRHFGEIKKKAINWMIKSYEDGKIPIEIWDFFNWSWNEVYRSFH